MKVHVTSVFLSVSAALVKLDLPVVGQGRLLPVHSRRGFSDSARPVGER
jgi:hypothetical protein